jgi:hypothetical protein
LTYNTDEIVKAVHEFYFEKDEVDRIGTFNYDFVEDVNLFVKLMCDAPIPRELYSKDAKTFPLTKKVKEYWLTNFKEVLADDRLKDINKNDKNYIVVFFDDLVNELVATAYEGFKPTKLGEFYNNKYSEETSLHNKMFQAVQYLDLPTAKKMVNKYVKMLLNMQRDINSYKEDSFNQNEYTKQLIQDIRDEIYLMNGTDDTQLNKFADELINRIQKGDIKLRDYISKNHAGDYIAEYRDYKHKNKEDTTEIDKYYSEFEETTEEYIEHGKRKGLN